MVIQYTATHQDAAHTTQHTTTQHTTTTHRRDNMPDIHDYLLSTLDNPYNPHTQYPQWRRWDIDNGYDTESLIARMANFPEDIDYTDEVTVTLFSRRAIIDILENDMNNIYVLVGPQAEEA